MDLKGRKILFITPKYYGYEELILDELRCKGAEVRIIYENLDEVSFLYRFIYVYLPSRKQKVLNHYYRKKIDKYGDKIDIVFVIRGSSLSSDVIRYMKLKYSSDCIFLMYQWDGAKNNPNVLKIESEFQKVYTFDVEDARNFGWIYRPLFYDEKMVSVQKDRFIDLLYICSLHSRRVEVLNKTKVIASKYNLKLYSHMYSKKIIYYKRKYWAKKEEYLAADDKDVKFNTLTIPDTYELYGKSKVVVDFTHPGQTGFTMRTIECIGNKCKLITNNEFIKTADFYDPRNILIYSGTDVDIPKDFVNGDYHDIDQYCYDYYSLSGWTNIIFGE